MLLLLLFGLSSEGISALFATSAGVLGMLAALRALVVQLDFLSGLAVPITIGIAGDYPLNVLGRQRQDGARAIRGAVSGAPARQYCSAG